MMPIHDHQWVTEQLAVGSAVTKLEHVEHLAQEGVTHLIDCRGLNPHPDIWKHSNVVRLQCGTMDTAEAIETEWFRSGTEFALKALRRSKNKILIHCAVGSSRSPSMTYAVLRLQGRPPEEAESLIRSVRPMVLRIKYKSQAEHAIRRLKRMNRR